MIVVIYAFDATGSSVDGVEGSSSGCEFSLSRDRAREDLARCYQDNPDAVASSESSPSRCRFVAMYYPSADGVYFEGRAGGDPRLNPVLRALC